MFAVFFRKKPQGVPIVISTDGRNLSWSPHSVILWWLGSAPCRQSKLSSTNSYVSRVAFVKQLFDQFHKRLSRVKIFLSGRGGFQGIDELRTGIKTQQQFFVGKTWATVLFP